MKYRTYTFVQDGFEKLPDAFFGRNFCVSAIVGKNGSGKSSILDIISRVLNNLCAVMCTNLNNEDYVAFCYIFGVRAELKFIGDGKEYSIECFDDTVFVTTKNNGSTQRYSFGKKIKRCCRCKHFTELYNEQRTSLTKHLFYCIVVNYALFALNSEEYEKETCVGVNDRLEPNKIELNSHNWLQSIFHKNDGYQSNITIVSLRDHGVFDATKETKLVRERILEILCVHKNFIDGYDYLGAHFKLNEDRFKNKFSLTRPTLTNGYNPKMDLKGLVQDFEKLLEDWINHGKETISLHILSELGYHKKDIVLGARPHILSYLYLVYKVLSCAQYPSLSEYKELYNID